MCSIVGSFKKDKLIELCTLNSYRGQHSHSISYYDIVTGELSVSRGEGPINLDDIKETPLVYILVHMQAPTGKEVNNIHPAHYMGKFLWHNGILKQTYIQQLKEKFKEVCEWDTFLMLKAITIDREMLNDLDGSFSCVLYDNEKLYLFRNEIAPLFIDAQLNISSVGFKGSNPTQPNKLHHLDFNFQSLFAVKAFTTKFNPYFLED